MANEELKISIVARADQAEAEMKALTKLADELTDDQLADRRQGQDRRGRGRGQAPHQVDGGPQRPRRHQGGRRRITAEVQIDDLRAGSGSSSQ